jgi:protein kinase A
MKILKKADIIKLKQVDHVISENTILADIDHPFLVRCLNVKVIGGFKRVLLRYQIFVFLDGLYSWR